MWRHLFLPGRVRQSWEERFPDLSSLPSRGVPHTDSFHAQIALEVAGAYGFALAGGYAVQVHGFLNLRVPMPCHNRWPGLLLEQGPLSS